MREFKAFFVKDLLIVLRDKTGLMLLFFLPMTLVLVMTAMQDSAFSETAKQEIPIIVVNKDHGCMGHHIVSALEQSQMFIITDLPELSVRQMDEKVHAGEFMAGLFVPEKLTESVEGNVRRCVDGFFSGEPSDTVQGDSSKQTVKILFDPAVTASFRIAMSNSINMACMEMQKSYLPQMISEEMNSQPLFLMSSFEMTVPEGVELECRVAKGGSDNDVIVNVAQHNVPAWSLFAIFFIAVALSINLIGERDKGILYRIQTASNMGAFFASKFSVYLIVCMIQFLLIAGMGIFLFPLIGLPRFVPGPHFLPLLVVMLCSAVAAIGYGMLIGFLFSTQQQASQFGAISIVVLSAIGGIWIPVFLMPGIMKSMSVCSPLNWGISACYDLLLRNVSLIDTLPYCLGLLVFSLISLNVSFFLLKYKQQNQ